MTAVLYTYTQSPTKGGEFEFSARKGGGPPLESDDGEECMLITHDAVDALLSVTDRTGHRRYEIWSRP